MGLEAPREPDSRPPPPPRIIFTMRSTNHGSCARLSQVTYRGDGAGSSGGGDREMEVTVSLPGVASAAGCEVRLEKWDGETPKYSSPPPSLLVPLPSSGDGVEVGQWCLMVEAAAAGVKLAVTLPSNATAVRDAGTARELDSLVVKFSRKHRRLTVRAALVAGCGGQRHTASLTKRSAITTTSTAASTSASTASPPAIPPAAPAATAAGATGLPAPPHQPGAAPSESERRLRERAVALWLQAGGAACHSEDGAGSDTPEASRWRAAYVEARLGDAHENIARALRVGPWRHAPP